MAIAGSVLVILLGVAMMVWGGKQGVGVTAPSPEGGTRSTKVYGTGALVLGIIVALFGVYNLLRAADVL